ncbi:MAG: hypothetical protein WCK96_10160 [Methylococcales bacterium]
MSNQIDTLHSKAMDIADAAFIAKRKREHKDVKRLSKDAFEYERDAALFLLEKTEIEPTRSILFRSAACLAFDAEEYRQAEEMANYGLQGNPPNDIKEELKELLQELKELKVVEDKVQKEKSDIFNIHYNNVDKAVSSGKIKLDYFSSITDSFSKLRKSVFDTFISDLDIFSTNPAGSFNLFLKPSERNQDDLFRGYSLEKRLSDILSYSSNVNSLRKLKLNERELSSLKSFLRCVTKNEASINFHFNSVSNEKINYSINKDKATSILNSIDKLDYSNDIEESYEGSFIAINLKTKSFIFSTENDDKPIYGKISDSIFSEIKKVSFSYFYKIKVFKHETKNTDERKPKIQRTLTYIVEISK